MHMFLTATRVQVMAKTTAKIIMPSQSDKVWDQICVDVSAISCQNLQFSHDDRYPQHWPKNKLLLSP